MDRRKFMTTGLTGAFALASGTHAWAQAYPERTIKIVQGFAPGGNADTIARLVGNEMSKELGQSFIVEAQTGAGGTIAAAAVARAKPDGYTLLLATGGHSVAGAMFNSLQYQTIASFDMISMVTSFPFLIAVDAKSKFRDFRELLAAAKSAPGSIAYGTAGLGTTHHLGGELLSKMASVDMLHVPYRGEAAALTALLGGEVPCIISAPTSIMSSVKAGKLRVLASTGSTRWRGLPDVPTVSEQGVTGYGVSSWAGLMAPAGTPKPIIARLSAEIIKAVRVPSVKGRLEDMGGEAQGTTPEEMKTIVTSELQRWTQLVAEAKIPKQ